MKKFVLTRHSTLNIALFPLIITSFAVWPTIFFKLGFKPKFTDALKIIQSLEFNYKYEQKVVQTQIFRNEMSTTILCNVLLDSWHGLDYCSSPSWLFPGPFFGRADPLGHVGQLPNVCSPGGLGQLQVVTHGRAGRSTGAAMIAAAAADSKEF